MQNVTLVGGPFDGRGLNWNGGDEIRLSIGPAVLDFTVATTDPFRPNAVVYRKSLVTPHLYVFQP